MAAEPADDATAAEGGEENKQSFHSYRTEPLSTDPFTVEFMYYTSVLKIIAPLSNETDRQTVIPWIRKLFRPEYQTTKLREKRNRYLALLTISLLMDDLQPNFRKFPPEGPLQDLCELKIPKVAAAHWETDTMWQDSLKSLPNTFKMLKCTIHENPDECKDEHELDTILDQEFQLFLHIVRPYASMLKGHDLTRVAAWLQVLCSVHGKECCSAMKAIRNDYIMALMAFLPDLRTPGPFMDYPPLKYLISLPDATAKVKDPRPITDPTHPEAERFLGTQEIPDDGAFCYIAVTGELVNSVTS